MKRRDFFRNSSLSLLGTSLLSSRSEAWSEPLRKDKVARNVIFMVSDGMSVGTLTMADLLLRRREGRASTWVGLYQDKRVRRALMDTASANALVTDSAAASSAWGGGRRVPNGSLNVNADGSANKPILQKFKAAGKAVGCVTSVPITHATPAGFCINNRSRGDQAEIAEQYLGLKFDVMLGGGREFFDKTKRKDGRDLLAEYEQAGYGVLLDRAALLGLDALPAKPLLGVFADNALPYALDAAQDAELQKGVPSLAEMTKAAINRLRKNKNGFVLQVEGGKVDWAAHANDTAGLLYDQLAFDEAVREVLSFAQADQETLVIITTDHGNANPGLFSDRHFDRIQHFKHTNDWILNGIDAHTTPAQLIERVEAAQGYAIRKEESETLLSFYRQRDESGLYNPAKLPFKPLGVIQSAYTGVGWAGTDHSADYVELTMLGPGSELLKPFVKNDELHDLMLLATAVASRL